MRVIGVIAEFNPFHNGHEYLIAKARKMVGDNRAVVMVVMSGPFVQRGTPSVFPKYERAKGALLCGADVVLELPFTFACSPSERFAHGAVELLYRTGVVTDLAFGIDCKEPELLKKIAETDIDEDILRNALSAGKSYPAAHADALTKSWLKANPEASEEEIATIRDTIHQPNSILAIDYLRAIKDSGARFKVHMINRIEGQSATGAREKLFDGDMNIPSVAGRLNGILPDKALAPCLAGLSSRSFSLPRRDAYISEIIKLVKRGDMSSYAYMGDGLDGYIDNTIDGLKNFSYESVMSALNTKHFTMPRIRRALASALIGQTSEYIETEKHVQYIRVLGFNKEGRYCLKVMSKCARLPIIHNCSDALEYYSEKPRLKEQFELDLMANNIQGELLNMERDYEWKKAPIIVK